DRVVLRAAECARLLALVWSGGELRRGARPRVLERAAQLLVDVPPLAHAQVAQEVALAELSQAALRELFQLVVQRFPDVEQREEIGVAVVEARVRLARGGLLVHRALARVLYRKRGCDDQRL